MPRKPTARPAGEHLATLTRVLRQVDVDDTLSARRRAAIAAALTAALKELQDHIAQPLKDSK